MDLRHDLTVVTQNGRGFDAGRNALIPLGSRSVLLDTFPQTPAYAGLRAYNLSEPIPERKAGQSGVISARAARRNRAIRIGDRRDADEGPRAFGDSLGQRHLLSA